jgi:iron complex transport system substrate-binding protein
VGAARGQRIFVALMVGALWLSHGAQPARGLTQAPAPTSGGGAQGENSGERQPPRAKREVTDDTGRRVTVAADVKRIVTLAPSLTETIYALGLEDKLAGDTDYCDTPAAAKSKPHVGSVLNPSLEAIVGLHPDLVLAAANTANRRETVDALEHLGLAVYASDPRTVRGMLDSTARIADLAGAEVQGASLAARLQARLDALHKRLDDLALAHVLFVVWEDPLITIGQNTFIADALRWAGAESAIVTNRDWPQISIEEVVRLQPDYIVLAATHGERDVVQSSEAQLKRLREKPVWRELRAVEAGRVVVVSDEIIRPSPGLIGVIEELARDLHPDAFEKAAGERPPVAFPPIPHPPQLRGEFEAATATILTNAERQTCAR